MSRVQRIQLVSLTLLLMVHSQLLVSQVFNTFYTTDITTDPGDFTNNTSARTTSLPTFQRGEPDSSFYVYDVEQIKEYKQGEQDGIYYLTVIDSSNKPSVAPFNGSDNFTFSQPVLNLYPQLDRDNPISESPASVLYFPINWVKL